jgi:cyanophycinase
VSSNLLFLLGGSAAFDVVAAEFVPAAGGADAIIALLLQGGSDWLKYVPEYVDPWLQRGVTRFHAIVPDENGVLDLDVIAARLREATGIFIGGGHTPTYQQQYATEPVRSLIRERYQEGVPVAGVSAGAALMPEVCVLSRDETSDEVLRTEEGLGLVGDLIVECHFSELNRLSHLLEAMAQLQADVGWGTDEPACMVFENGQFTRILGRSVHRVVMTELATRTYEVTEYTGS